jgi:hypothetical protein
LLDIPEEDGGLEAVVEGLSDTELLVALFGIAVATGSFLTVALDIGLTGAGADGIAKPICSSCHCRASSSSVFKRSIVALLSEALVTPSTPVLRTSEEDTPAESWGAALEGFSDTELLVALLGSET